MEINIVDIRIKDRKRKLDIEKVATLASSIHEIGLLNPVTVRSVNSHYELVAGAHRLEACKLLQLTTIRAELFEGDDLGAELAEIDENLRRNDLTALEQGEHLLRRNEILSIRGMRAQRGDNRFTDRGDTVSPLSTAQIAAELGMSERSAQRKTQAARDILPAVKDAIRNTPIADSTTQLLELARLEPIEQQKVADIIELAGDMTVSEAKKQIKQEQRQQDIERQREEIANGTAVLPQGLFEVIAIDPPWPYGTEYDPDGRRAANPYPEMSLEEIAALDIPATADCILWLWTTHKFMRYSFDLLDRWGFRDVAIVTWEKSRMGLGSWLRSKSEFCIMAVKGKPIVSLGNQTTVIHGDMREHSRKPDEFYQMVDSLCIGRKLDYFSREAHPGWECFGNDTRKFENGELE